MEERVEKMFAELAQSEGFEAWWETEERWEAWAQIMIEAGLDDDVVTDFFSEMAQDIWVFLLCYLWKNSQRKMHKNACNAPVVVIV